MKKIVLFVLSFLIGILLVIWIYRHIGLDDIFLRFSFLVWWQVAILFFLVFLKILAWVIRWKMILKTIGFSNLPFRSLAGARLGEMALSYLTPGFYYGGEVVRVFVAKNKMGIPVFKGIISIVIERIIEIFSFFLFCLLGVFIIFLKGDWVNFAIFSGLSILPLIVLFLILKLIKSEKIISLLKLFKFDRLKLFGNNQDNNKDGLAEKIREFNSEIIGFFKKSPQVAFWGVILSVFGFFVGALEMVYFAHFLKESLLLTDAVLIKIADTLSGAVPIPATLGIYEWVNVLVFQMVESSVETGLSFSLISRLIDFSFVSIGLLVVIYYFTHNLLGFSNNQKQVDSIYNDVTEHHKETKNDSQ